MSTPDSGRSTGPGTESAPDVSRACIGEQPDLTGPRHGAFEGVDQGDLEPLRDPLRDLLRGVESASAEAVRGRGHGGQNRPVGPGTGGSRETSPEERGDLPPAVVLERLDEAGGGGRPRGGGARRHPGGPRRAQLAVLRAWGRPRGAATGTGRRGERGQPGGAARTDRGTLSSPSGGATAPEAAERKEEIDHPTSASPSRSGSARRMASSGASTPHHRSKAAAPCCTSISRPSVARTPIDSAARTRAVGSAP